MTRANRLCRGRALSNKWISYNGRYKQYIKKQRHQHNTDDGGQAMGEEMRHVQMSR